MPNAHPFIKKRRYRSRLSQPRHRLWQHQYIRPKEHLLPDLNGVISTPGSNIAELNIRPPDTVGTQIIVSNINTVPVTTQASVMDMDQKSGIGNLS